MKMLVMGLMALAVSQFAVAEPKVTYVGMGRYACSGSDRECEPVRRRNDDLEVQRQQTRELELQRRELEKQTELMRSEQRRWEQDRERRY